MCLKSEEAKWFSNMQISHIFERISQLSPVHVYGSETTKKYLFISQFLNSLHSSFLIILFLLFSLTILYSGNQNDDLIWARNVRRSFVFYCCVFNNIFFAFFSMVSIHLKLIESLFCKMYLYGFISFVFNK